MVANVKSLVVVGSIFIVDEPYMTCEVEERQGGLAPELDTGLSQALTDSGAPPLMLTGSAATQPNPASQWPPSKLLPSICPFAQLQLPPHPAGPSAENQKIRLRPLWGQSCGQELREVALRGGSGQPGHPHCRGGRLHKL